MTSREDVLKAMERAIEKLTEELPDWAASIVANEVWMDVDKVYEIWDGRDAQ